MIDGIKGIKGSILSLPAEFKLDGYMDLLWDHEYDQMRTEADKLNVF